MAITYPMDLLVDFPGWSTQFELFWRQEQSRTANGRTIVKDFGTPLWRATYQTRQLKPNALDYWKARLNALENGLQTFYGRPISRCSPIDDPRSVKLGSAVLEVDAIAGNRKELSISGFPSGYKLSAGDCFTIEGSVSPTLYQCVSAATANANGLVSSLEVRPHIAPDISAAATVHLQKPYCIMALVPGSISASSGIDARGSISFQAIEVR